MECHRFFQNSITMDIWRLFLWNRPRYLKQLLCLQKQETILPAPESAHAIYGAIQEALKCKETGEEKTILFGLTGTGYFDMVAYQRFHGGEMQDYVPTDAELQESFAKLPHIV